MSSRLLHFLFLCLVFAELGRSTEVGEFVSNENGGEVQSSSGNEESSNIIEVTNSEAGNAGQQVNEESEESDEGEAEPSVEIPKLMDPSSGSEAFVQAVLMIFATEIGDKTFFIAAIMAMRHSRVLVLTGALSALWVMTVMSVVIGFALPHLIPDTWTHYAAAGLFAYFGLRLLWEAAKNTGEGPSDELEEVEKELDAVEKETSKKETDVEAASQPQGSSRTSSAKVISEAFALTFLAEWGDRSQIATIALAAAADPFGVTLGGCIGHAICTGLAVQGGRLLAARISERTVGFVGGVLFLVFAGHELLHAD